MITIKSNPYNDKELDALAILFTHMNNDFIEKYCFKAESCDTCEYRRLCGAPNMREDFREGLNVKYSNEQIEEVLRDFIKDTQQTELRYVVAFALGYFGYITKQIWSIINKLITDGVIQ